MSWIVPALIAPLVFTTINFTDKFVIERAVRDTRAMPIYSGIVTFFWGVVFWLATGTPVFDPQTTLLLLGQGVLLTFGAALYFRALGTEATSSVIILLQTTPVIVLALSFVFLGATISEEEALGFVLILSAAIGISIVQSPQGGGFKLSPAFFMISIGNTMVAVALVLAKFNVDNLPVPQVLAYQNMSFGLGALILCLLPGFRHAFLDSLRNVPRRVLGVIGYNESLFTLVQLVKLIAFALGGPVALVSVLESTQIFFGVFFGWALTLIAPKTFQEDIRARTLLRKGAMTLMLFTGIGLLA